MVGAFQFAHVKPDQASSSFREDIQALRGLAILLVLLHHAKLDFLTAGYLGVDIFFVISGYLITQIIRKDLESGTFSFPAFYFRRAKRLLPAAYVTLLAVILLSALFLTQSEARDFFRQLVGAVTFTGNIALWLQTGYFEGAANLKPLLHVWSLSIEEQYYLLLPAAMVLAPRRYWLPAMLLLLILSMTLCIALAGSKPSATFYLLPTRGWELALGSVGALWGTAGGTARGTAQGSGRPARAVLDKRLSSLVWPAIMLLVVIPAFPTRIMQPWGDAAIVCVATLVVLLGRHPALVRSAALLPLARLGDFSYSLYLVHWPLFAFANNAYVSPVPMQVNIGLALAAVALGYALYRFVERPMRRAPIALSRRSVSVIVAASVALVLICLGVTKFLSPAIDYADSRKSNRGFAPECASGSEFRLMATCSNSSAPRILIWGDSFAMHLIPGIAATTEIGIAQATMSGCGPLDGLVQMREPDRPRPWAMECLRFNQSVLEYLATAKSIEVVVLSSILWQYVGDRESNYSVNLLRTERGEMVQIEPSVAVAVERMGATVAKLRALGKKVVVVAPTPFTKFDIRRCLELKASGRMFFGADGYGCRVSRAAYHQDRALVLQLLASLPGAAAVNVVAVDDALCSAQTCETELDGVFLYGDARHLSIEGSRKLAIRAGLANRLLAAAR